MPIELKSTKASVVIYPEYAGLLNNFKIIDGEVELDVLYGYNSEEEIGRELSNDFRSAKLSPFANRIKGGKYSFEGRDYQLPINFPNEGNSIHGLIYNKPFEVEEQTNSALRISYKVERGSFKGYPFSYSIMINYFLEKSKLTCTTVVTNDDNEVIPVGDGIHPYFRLKGSIDEVEMKLPELNLIEVDEKLIPTGSISEYNVFQDFKKLKGVDLDHGFVLKQQNGVVETVLKQGDTSLIVRQEVGENKYNFLQVYTPPHRESIAIEPMTSAVDCLNNKKGLIVLKPGESLKTTYEIEVV